MNAWRKRKWDTVIAVLAPIVTVAGILIGVWQFNRGEQDRTKEDFNQQLFIQRIAACEKISEVAGAIAATTDNKQRRQLAKQFDAYYWGLAVLVEDASLQTAMREFHDELHDYIFEPKWTDDYRIKRKALAFAQACRASLHSSNAAGL